MSRPSRISAPAALVILALALVVASTTTAWAAVKIGTSQLKNSAVTTAKIKDQTIQIADVSPEAQSALRGQTGAAGPKGETGAAGAPGATGEKGAKGDPGAPGSGLGAAYVPWTAEFTNSIGGTLAPPSVNRIADGIYCLSGPGWEYRGDRMFVVQPYNVGGSWAVMASVDDHYSAQCGSFDDYLVVIITDRTGAKVNANFAVARLF